MSNLGFLFRLDDVFIFVRLEPAQTLLQTQGERFIVQAEGV